MRHSDVNFKRADVTWILINELTSHEILRN